MDVKGFGNTNFLFPPIYIHFYSCRSNIHHTTGEYNFPQNMTKSFIVFRVTSFSLFRITCIVKQGQKLSVRMVVKVAIRSEGLKVRITKFSS